MRDRTADVAADDVADDENDECFKEIDPARHGEFLQSIHEAGGDAELVCDDLRDNAGFHRYSPLLLIAGIVFFSLYHNFRILGIMDWG